MIGVVAEITVREDKREDFARVAGELAEAVNANEPGCVLYELYADISDPNLFVFMEKYTDKEALAVHGQTDYFLAAQAQFKDMVAGPPKVRVLKSV